MEADTLDASVPHQFGDAGIYPVRTVIPPSRRQETFANLAFIDMEVRIAEWKLIEKAVLQIAMCHMGYGTPLQLADRLIQSIALKNAAYQSSASRNQPGG